MTLTTASSAAESAHAGRVLIHVPADAWRPQLCVHGSTRRRP